MIRGEIVGDAEEPLLDDLRAAKLLEAREPPSFGHAKRAEAIQHWLIEERRGDTRIEATALIHRLAGAVRELRNAKADASAGVLESLLPSAAELDLDALTQGLCRAAATLSRGRTMSSDALLAAAEEAIARETHSGAALLAMSLVNTQNRAKEENALERRDELLNKLRRLAEQWPDDTAIRGFLATGLLNTLYHAKAENALQRRDDLLDELRQLAERWPEDATVREILAAGLFQTLNHAKTENAIQRCDELLDELRRLAETWPDDDAVRENLVKSLVNSLIYGEEDSALERRDELLNELRHLAKRWPSDDAVRERLAIGLYDTLLLAKADNALERRDELLDELSPSVGPTTALYTSGWLRASSIR
jgi:tetratricopeptide (TPR) repeat protein